jgi:hypothetical protein
MKEYTVEIVLTVTYELHIEAETSKEAQQKAEEIFDRDSIAGLRREAYAVDPELDEVIVSPRDDDDTQEGEPQ